MAETCGKSLEEVRQFDFEDWTILRIFFETNPPLRQHINFTSAQICQSIAALGRGKGKRVPTLDKFVIDYEKARQNSPAEVAKRLDLFLGGMAAKSKQDKKGKK